MDKLFDSMDAISEEEFFGKWALSERARGSIDQFALDLMAELKERNLKCYVVTLSERGLSNVILPCHMHDSEIVGQGGEPFWTVVSRYSKLALGGTADGCLQRVSGIKECVIDRQFTYSKVIEAKFVFTSSDRQLMKKHRYSDHGPGKLYAGNIHQFIAYGIWLKNQGHSPRSHRIKVYCCTQREG